MGASRRINLDRRRIVASRRDLEGAVERGTLGEDLYRLCWVALDVPPPHERREVGGSMVREELCGSRRTAALAQKRLLAAPLRRFTAHQPGPTSWLGRGASPPASARGVHRDGARTRKAACRAMV
ncbi:MAG: hypothetical protein HYU42_13530 [Candidatus Rokubacteria bacterium]|nr:hypothetical protein [Candidatus Rokubacteria bacterium]MBI3105696.1 hypothetical protein [Candidatus Rokubacteria bacterium]